MPLTVKLVLVLLLVELLLVFREPSRYNEQLAVELLSSVSLNVNVWDAELELVLLAGLTRFMVGGVVSPEKLNCHVSDVVLT